VSDRNAKITWVLPNYGPIWAPVYSSHMQIIAYTSRYMEVNHLGQVVGIGCTDRSYTHSAENNAVSSFLKDPNSTHIFMTESDMIMPKETILDLLDLDKDIVSGVYFLRGGSGQPCLYRKVLTPSSSRYPHTPVRVFPTDRPFRVDCPGLGCVLIKRGVFEKWDGSDSNNPRGDKVWFDLREGAYGSDMYFYTHAREHGFEVWVNPKVMCEQIDYYVTGIEDYRRRIENDPHFARDGFIINADLSLDDITGMPEGHQKDISCHKEGNGVG